MATKSERVPDPLSSVSGNSEKQVTPLRAWTGAFVSGVLGILLYRLTYAIAMSFANHPSVATSQMAQRISAAVRTLVVGLTTMATGLFAIAALGLVLLGFKLLFQDLTKAAESDP